MTCLPCPGYFHCIAGGTRHYGRSFFRACRLWQALSPPDFSAPLYIP